MDISDIKDSSIFVFFPANGQSYEFPVSHFPTFMAEKIADRIDCLSGQLTGFLKGSEPFVHTAPNGVRSFITPCPGLGINILPGSCFKSFIRNIQLQQSRQQLGLVQANGH